MAEKDITERHLEEFNDVFADIVNVLLFGGEAVVQEDELDNVGSSKDQFRAETEQVGNRSIHETERDITKIWKKGGVAISVIGLENQDEPDRTMPLRVLAYDGASYKSELIRMEEQRKKDRNAGGIDVQRQYYPVISLVLSFSERHWHTARTIHEAVMIPERLKPFVSDYQINVFEISWLENETVQMFRSDFRFVAEYFVQRRRNEDYRPSEQIVRHVDATLKAMSALTGDRRFETAYNVWAENDSGKGAFRMEKMLDRIEERGYVKGEAKGRQQEKEDNIARMADYFQKERPEMTREQAVEFASSILR